MSPPPVRMIIDLNITYCRDLLATETDPSKRETIVKLRAAILMQLRSTQRVAPVALDDSNLTNWLASHSRRCVESAKIG